MPHAMLCRSAMPTSSPVRPLQSILITRFPPSYSVLRTTGATCHGLRQKAPPPAASGRSGVDDATKFATVPAARRHEIRTAPRGRGTGNLLQQLFLFQQPGHFVFLREPFCFLFGKHYAAPGPD